MDTKSVATFKPHSLLTDGHVSPRGVASEFPELRWSLDGITARRASCVGYEVQVSDNLDALLSGDANWWSDVSHTQGARESSATVTRKVMSRATYFWRVRAIIGAQRTAWSDPEEFTVSLLHASDWRAAWITRNSDRDLGDNQQFAGVASPVFGKQVTVRTGVRRATWFVTALGYGEYYIGGQQVSLAVLAPNWTQFNKRVHFEAIDVTKTIKPGEHWLTIHAGNGFWNPFPLRMWGSINLREHLPTGSPMAMGQLEIEYVNGQRDVFATDASWQVWDGPSQRNSVYMGERVDAGKRTTLAAPGTGTRKVDVFKGEIGALEPTPLEPVTTIGTRGVTSVTRKGASYVLDFGQNMTGRIRAAVRVSNGKSIAVITGERLFATGIVNPLTAVCGQIKRRTNPPGSNYPVTAVQEDVLIGDGKRTDWAPSFTFHGFRYAEVTGLEQPPVASDWVAEQLASSVRRTATFTCSDPMLNRLFEITTHTFQSNLVSVQSDCPHREKFGYGGDILCTSETAWHLFDMERFYRKTITDHIDAQRENGGFTMTAPFVGIADSGLGEKSGPVDWGTAVPLLVDGLIRFHGDTATAKRFWPALVAWWNLLETRAVNGILDNGLGDHETLVERSTAVTGTLALLQNADLMARIAGHLGNVSAKIRYEAHAVRIRKVLLDTFQRPDGTFGIRSQACYAGGLFHRVISTKVGIDGLSKVLSAADNHNNTGIFGTLWLLEALSQHGRGDLAVVVATQKTFPSWGHMLQNGATTLWEPWKESDDTFSNSHPMFGSVAGWMVRWLAGIQCPEDAIGADRVIIRPLTNTTITHAEGSWLSRRGEVRVRWARAESTLTMDVTIPVSMSAEIYLPSTATDLITESGKSILSSEGLQIVMKRLDATVVRAVGGTYHFRINRGSMPR